MEQAMLQPGLANRATLLNILFQFIKEIGIEISERTISEKGFIDGVLIEAGKLVVDRDQLLYPGDLLHEAGHIAVAPSAERNTLGTDVTMNRPGSEGEEVCVLLWTWAACVHLQLPPETVFHPGGYKGESDWILQQFRNGNYIGLPLLVWMGLSDDPAKSETGFPVMKKWMRD